jgi:hypothetical protein
MSAPKPTRERPEGDREVDVHELPRNEATRQRPTGAAGDDPRAGETAAQDRIPSADDINIEATLLERSTYPPSVEDWRQARRRVDPGLDDGRGEPSPVRGPSADSSTGRAVTERETVADDEADADATDRNAARRDDPDAT